MRSEKSYSDVRRSASSGGDTHAGIWQSWEMTPDTLGAAEDEAQRTLERKALRNVRSLVDKLETDERTSIRRTLRFVAATLAIALLAATALYFAMTGQKKTQPPVVSTSRAAPPSSAGR